MLADVEVMGGEVDGNHDETTNLQEAVSREGGELSHVLHRNTLIDPRIYSRTPATITKSYFQEQRLNNGLDKITSPKGNQVINSAGVENISDIQTKDGQIMEATLDMTSVMQNNKTQTKAHHPDDMNGDNQVQNMGSMAEDMGTMVIKTRSGDRPNSSQKNHVTSPQVLNNKSTLSLVKKEKRCYEEKTS